MVAGMEKYFQATPEELGEASAAANRQEISDLMAQVGKGLRQTLNAVTETARFREGTHLGRGKNNFHRI